MPRNDDGEFELILGNKQLLSVFFIVIILLGVFFTMGYIVGRNSGTPEVTKLPTATDAVAPARTGGPSSMPPAVAPAAAETPVVEPVTTKQPDPAPVVEAPKLPHKAPIEVTAVTRSVSQPIPGQIYIQVLAVAKPEAEVLVDVLAKKGFRAMVAPGPNEKIYRVLVGPAKDASDAGKLKGDLEQAGFKLAFPNKF